MLGAARRVRATNPKSSSRSGKKHRPGTRPSATAFCTHLREMSSTVTRTLTLWTWFCLLLAKALKGSIIRGAVSGRDLQRALLERSPLGRAEEPQPPSVRRRGRRPEQSCEPHGDPQCNSGCCTKVLGDNLNYSQIG